MTNKFMNGLTAATNFTYTENGAVTHKTTMSDLLDMFALGGAYRTRSDADVINLFNKALMEDEVHALKCLFYLRDCRGGQGERRFFRVAMTWLAKQHPDMARRNLEYVPEFGRWDDLYIFVGTPLEKDAFKLIKSQLALDVQSKTPSLLAKWLKSENTSSKESCKLGNKTRTYLGMTHKQYRKTLSVLRTRINIVEKLMSENRWDEIEFDKIPSRAGFIYKNAFARRDIIKAKYEAFAKDENTKVNAKTLYPYECVAEALKCRGQYDYRTRKYIVDETNRAMVNKYWANLADYINGAEFNGMAIVDTSGSMCGSSASAPINVAISLGLYCAEKAKGPYAGHFMTFNSNPKLVRVEGVDFVDKVQRMSNADWGGSTNIEAAFDLLLNTALTNRCTQEEIPQNLIVISDMEFNSCVTTNSRRGYGYYGYGSDRYTLSPEMETLFEAMERKWAQHGYKMPHLVFWNVQARQDNIPMRDNGNVSYVSGMSPVLYEQIMKGLTAVDLMLNKLDSERYACIK